MKIKEYTGGWPPIITIGAGRDFSGAELADVVMSLRKYAEAKDRIILETRDKNGIAYGIPLSLPANVLENVCFSSTVVVSELCLKKRGYRA